MPEGKCPDRGHATSHGGCRHPPTLPRRWGAPVAARPRGHWNWETSTRGGFRVASGVRSHGSNFPLTQRSPDRCLDLTFPVAEGQHLAVAPTLLPLTSLLQTRPRPARGLLFFLGRRSGRWRAEGWGRGLLDTNSFSPGGAGARDPASAPVGGTKGGSRGRRAGVGRGCP